jgi:ferritin-like metal-binding protein YciE
MAESQGKRTTSKNTGRVEAPKSFLNKLGEMHTAERELTLALPLIIKAANSKDLKTLLQLHLKETKGHLKALDGVAQNLEQELPTKGCKRMTQLVAEGVKVIGQRLISSDKDPEIIAVGRKIEQFEISSYEELCGTAKEKGYTHEFALLTSILNQEKIANDLLGKLAEGKGPIKKLIEKVSLKKAGASK